MSESNSKKVKKKISSLVSAIEPKGRKERLRIRSGAENAPPKSFEWHIRWPVRLLNATVLASLVMLAVICILPIEDIYTADGVVRPSRYRYLYASADLEQRGAPLVSEGQEVKKGDLLMRFYLPDMEDEILQARQDLETARADLDVQKAKTASLEKLPLPKELWEMRDQLSQARLKTEYLKTQLERSKTLRASGDISQQELDKARMEYEQTVIESDRLAQRMELIDTGYTDTLLAQAHAEEHRIAGQIEIIQTRLERLESEHHRLSELRAPDDGMILEMPYKNIIGTIARGQRLVYMSIGDGRTVQMFGMQKNFDKVQIGQRVRYKSQVYDYMKFDYAEGHVVKISQIREGPVQSPGDGNDERYYSIIATIDKQPKELTLDSNVTAQIIIRKTMLLRVLFGTE